MPQNRAQSGNVYDEADVIRTLARQRDAGYSLQGQEFFADPLLPDFLCAMDPKRYLLTGVTTQRMAPSLPFVKLDTFDLKQIYHFKVVGDGPPRTLSKTIDGDGFELLGTGNLRSATTHIGFSDMLIGADRRNQAYGKTFPGETESQLVKSPFVVRGFVDADTGLRLGERVLIDPAGIEGHRDTLYYARLYHANGMPSIDFVRKGNGLLGRTHYDATGARTHMAFTDGRVNVYHGASGHERLVHVTMDPAQSGGVVKDFYTGSAGAAYLVRRHYQDGRVAFYRGATPSGVAVAKIWHAGGRTEFYEGPRDEEVKVGEGHEATPVPLGRALAHKATPAPAPAPAPATGAAFRAGATVRIGTAHRRTDLHGKPVVLQRQVPGEPGRWVVAWAASVHPTPSGSTDAALGWVFDEPHLLSEADFQTKLAAAVAARAAKAEAKAARARAKKLAKQCTSDAKLASEMQALAVDERDAAAEAEAAAAAAAHTIKPPPEGKQPLSRVARCPHRRRAAHRGGARDRRVHVQQVEAAGVLDAEGGARVAGHGRARDRGAAPALPHALAGG